MAEFKIDKITFKTETKNKLKSESITKRVSSACSEYLVKIELENEESPSTYSITWEEDQIDMLGFWSPLSFFSSNITPDWGMRRQDSRTSFGMPVITIFNKESENRTTIALSDPSTPTAIMAGVVEENGKIIYKIDIFSNLCAKLKSYETVIRIDQRKIPFGDAVISVREWWDELGYKSAYAPKEAKMPMYSTWYSFHQHVNPEEILNECKIAKEYGMDTVIVDDGWQTDDNSRGYAYCGDWRVCESKIPDMKKFVDDVHALGMKLMLWYSVPFVGYESENYEKFKGMYLRHRENQRASVLDPRFKVVRDFLIDIYCDAVDAYGYDGLKLDFIDSFILEEGVSSTDYERMDYVSLEEAIDALIREASERLKAKNPDFMIEFRQGYIGPILSKYATFFRVLDCPNDALINRICSLGLRLTSSKTPVHSDMLMWNKDDTNESVANQLLSTLFAVPQISVRFDNITSDHKRILKSYLDFWRAHSDTILNGKLEVLGIDANFTMAKSQKDGESVAILYQSVVYTISEKEAYIFNSTGSSFVYVESDTKKSFEVYNIFGDCIENGELKAGINKINVPNGAMIRCY